MSTPSSPPPTEGRPTLSQGGRLVVAVDETNIGARVSIRYLLRGQHPADSEVLMTDVVGHLEAWGEGIATVLRRTGESVDVPIAAIVAAKVVPPRPPRPADTPL